MSIYTSPPIYTSQLPQTAGENISQDLTFTSVGVSVDNPTGWWLYLPQLNRFVAPYTFGATYAMPGSTTVEALWQAPNGYANSAAPASPPASATLVWLSANINFELSGGSAVLPSQPIPVSQGSFPGNPLILPSNSTNSSEVITVPNGVASLALFVQAITDPANVLTNLQVEYNNAFGTQQLYQFVSNIQAGTIVYVPLPIPQETQSYTIAPQIEIVASTPNTNVGNTFILPVFQPPGALAVASIINTANDPVVVEVTNASPTAPLNTAAAPFGWSKTGQFNNVTATLSYTPPVGHYAVITYASLEINNSGAVAFSTDLELTGSVLGQVWAGKISVPGVNGSVDRNDVTGIAYAFGVNEVVTLKTAIALGATIFGDLNLGGYFV